MTITKKTRLLAKPGPVIHRVVSGGHGEDADALYENTGLVIEGERLGDIESVEIHFKTVDGEALNFDVDGWISSKTDTAIRVDTTDLFRKFRTWCKDESSALDCEAGATVKLIGGSGTVAASRDVRLIEAEDTEVTVTGVRDKNVYSGPAEITVGANEVSVGGTGFLVYPPGEERSLLYLNGELLVDPIATGSGMEGVTLTLKDKYLNGQPGDDVKVVLMWNGRAYIAHGTLKSA